VAKTLARICDFEVRKKPEKNGRFEETKNTDDKMERVASSNYLRIESASAPAQWPRDFHFEVWQGLRKFRASGRIASRFPFQKRRAPQDSRTGRDRGGACTERREASASRERCKQCMCPQCLGTAAKPAGQRMPPLGRDRTTTPAGLAMHFLYTKTRASHGRSVRLGTA
jgi:hypothetical protein